MKQNRYRHLILLSVLFLVIPCLGGCMEAGAADWIGAKKVETVAEEEPSTEEPMDPETVGEVEGGDREIENELPTYTIPEEEIEEEEEEEVEEEEEEEEEEVSENAVEEEEEEEDDGENHDVTKGSWDGDDWYAEATIGEGYSIEVTVTSTREAMAKEKVDSYEPAAKQKGNNIDDVRFAYFKKYEEGDKEAAADDVEDYEDIDEMHSKQMDAIMAVADDIGKLIAQFGITAYDFGHPAENDDDGIIVLDLYRKNNFQYLMTVTFSDENSSKIESIEFDLET